MVSVLIMKKVRDGFIGIIKIRKEDAHANNPHMAPTPISSEFQRVFYRGKTAGA